MPLQAAYMAMNAIKVINNATYEPQAAQMNPVSFLSTGSSINNSVLASVSPFSNMDSTMASTATVTEDEYACEPGRH